VQRSLRGRHVQPGSPSGRLHRAWVRTAVVGTALAAVSVTLPSSIGSAAQQQSPPSLSSLVAQAKVLSNQITNLSNQYDGLKIQLAQARTQAQTAAATAARDEQALSGGQLQIGRLAAQSYINGTVDPTLQFISSSNPQLVVGRAAIMQQLDTEEGTQVSQLAAAEDAAKRAQETANQQAQTVTNLASKMQATTKSIQAKVSTLDSAAFAQAMKVFSQTGSFPLTEIPGGNTVGEQALRWALTRRGYPYVWGAVGPYEFDCSGLVVWSYAKLGIHLDHFTGDLWNEGVHVSRDQLQPGDLVFFYPTASHVGIYIGNGLMVDAPSTGQDVMVQPVMWNVYVGAVRIV
jgi:peptidoglycan DL-endopeptidase CwlO